MLAEWVVTAKKHRLTLVEPCVRDGSIVPCTHAHPQLPLSAYLDLDHLRRAVSIITFDEFCDTFRRMGAEDRTIDVRYSGKRCRLFLPPPLFHAKWELASGVCAALRLSPMGLEWLRAGEYP